MSRNARFWVYVNGDWAKLTLTGRRPMSWGSYRRHDEGWSSESISWELCEGVVYMSCHTDGRDCDGRMETSDEFSCPVDELRGREVGRCPECGGVLHRKAGERGPVCLNWAPWGKRRPPYLRCGRLPAGIEWRGEPAWERDRSCQRDHFAEAAGY